MHDLYIQNITVLPLQRHKSREYHILTGYEKSIISNEIKSVLQILPPNHEVDPALL